MGGAIARNLLRAGVAVIGHDIDGARAHAFAAAGGRRASSAREVAERGDIIVYASGTEGAIERCRRVLDLVSREVINVGPFGTGSRLKYVANHLVAIHIAAAGEALALARNAGVDPAFAIRVLSAGAGTSRMLEIRGPMMAARKYSPPSMTIRLFQKDLRIITEFAKSCGVPVPLLATASQLFAAALDEEF